MTGMAKPDGSGGWQEVWARMSDKELESAARDYIWLAGTEPNNHRGRRDEIVAEAQRRGKPEIIERAGKLTRRSSPWKSIASRKRRT
jgi:hypothetical protein